MGSQPVSEAIEPGPGSGPLARVALCLDNAAEREALAQWLQDAPNLNLATDVEAPDTDVVLADPRGLGMHRDRLTALRAEQYPLVLPVLLLVPANQPLDALSADLLELSDDLVRVPVSPADLRFRLKSALRTREMSLALSQSIQFEQRLVGVVGHDMRSPLSVLSMVADMLGDADTELPPHLRRLGGRVKRAATTLTHLAEDLLLVAHGRSGAQLKLERVPCELEPVLADAIQLTASSSRVTLSSVGDCAAEVDAQRVQQAVINLLQNALRHGTPDGEVAVHVDGSAPDSVAIAVSNDGSLGDVAPEQLFDSFHQGAKASGGGVGLGLYIVRHLARAHGGTIEARSAEGTVTFTLHLPRQAPQGTGA